MEDSSSERHKQERALRAIQVCAVSGFLADNRGLTESCLVLCNLCRECVPVRDLRIDRHAPSTLTAVFRPSLASAKAEGDSRVLMPRRVLEIRWMFYDPVATHFWEDGEEDEEEEVKEEEQEEDGNKDEGEEDGNGDKGENKEKGRNKTAENVERGPVIASCIDFSNARWPEGLRKVFLISFNRPVDGAVGPDSLQVLGFHIPSRVTRDRCRVHGTGGIFNMPLDGVKFPAGLRELFLGHNFNQCIDAVAWPEGLERLSMPGFNQPIRDIQWPSGLKTLEFIPPGELEIRETLGHLPWNRQEWGFDHPLGTFLPMSLETLLLSDNFNQPLQGVTWPSKLAVLGLGAELPEDSFTEVMWPPSLRKIVSSGSCFDVRDAPPGCRVLRLEESDESDIAQDEFDFDPFNGLSEYEDGFNYESAGSDFSL